jgi:hypothetical protein
MPVVAIRLSIEEATRKLNALAPIPMVAKKLLALDMQSTEGEVEFMRLIKATP